MVLGESAGSGFLLDASPVPKKIVNQLPLIFEEIEIVFLSSIQK